jgi:hypothetical protein
VETNLAEAERRIEEARRTQAESLDLGDLALSELPAGLGDLPHLKTLHLGISSLRMQEDLNGTRIESSLNWRMYLRYLVYEAFRASTCRARG